VETVQTPGAIASRERDVLRVGLFDIVKKECGQAQGTIKVSAGTIRRVSTPRDARETAFQE
jgi:hypothetical protein